MYQKKTQKKSKLKYNLADLDVLGYVCFAYDDQYRVTDYYSTVEEINKYNITKFILVSSSLFRIFINKDIDITSLYISDFCIEVIKTDPYTLFGNMNCFYCKDKNIQDIIAKEALEQYKSNLISFLRTEADNLSSHGRSFLYNGEFIVFTLSMNDRDNIRLLKEKFDSDKSIKELELINNDKKYLFKRKDFFELYNEIENEQIINEYYFETLLEWINETFTYEVLEEKPQIHYGFTNEYIAERLREKIKNTNVN